MKRTIEPCSALEDGPKQKVEESREKREEETVRVAKGDVQFEAASLYETYQTCIICAIFRAE